MSASLLAKMLLYKVCRGQQGWRSAASCPVQAPQGAALPVGQTHSVGHNVSDVNSDRGKNLMERNFFFFKGPS